MVSSLLSNDTSLTDTTQRQKMGFVERLPRLRGAGKAALVILTHTRWYA